MLFTNKILSKLPKELRDIIYDCILDSVAYPDRSVRSCTINSIPLKDGGVVPFQKRLSSSFGTGNLIGSLHNKALNRTFRMELAKQFYHRTTFCFEKYNDAGLSVSLFDLLHTGVLGSAYAPAISVRKVLVGFSRSSKGPIESDWIKLLGVLKDAEIDYPLELRAVIGALESGLFWTMQAESKNLVEALMERGVVVKYTGYTYCGTTKRSARVV